MKLDSTHDQTQLNSMLYHDQSTLANIKQSRDQEGALEVVAGQFEAMFLQMVLRQMRSSSDVLADKDSPFSSQQQGVFRDMHDGQLAMELAKKQGSGIANMLIQQLSPSMQEVAFDTSRNVSPANDGKQDDSESLSLKVQEENTGLFNAKPETVASVKQVLGEAGLSTAFSQPLIRKMEL
ncbi:flagellar protein FlgJ [Vibrio sp. ES.051]|uniref:rod-binding protein n=1 Tax=Vibrio sp. ES.051 TaxID=1761909 RepID=UPI000BF3D62F|nr:rod-binding protein [Vibrio sp. ES.051]PFG57721.1 flagellar protein FlgJ [Vibrio sp. ES.051]